MVTVSQPDNEADRLASLHALGVLDTPPEAQFDALARAAALATGTPIALISLIDSGRQWLKASYGLTGMTEIPRALALCAHTILQDRVLEIADVASDSRFADNPLVSGGPGIQFYAGVPICLRDAARVGTLCVMAGEFRCMTPGQLEILRQLSVAAGEALEARRTTQLLQDAQQTIQRVRAEHESLRKLYESTPAMLHSLDAEGRLAVVSDMWLSKLEYAREEVIGRVGVEFLTPESHELTRTTTRPALFKHGRCDEIEHQMVTRSGNVIDVLVSGVLERDESGKPTRSIVNIQDVTVRRRVERALVEERKRLDFIIEGTHAGAWEWNVQTEETRFSQQWARIIGYTLEELGQITVHAWLERAHPQDLVQSHVILKRHLAGEIPSYESEVRLRHRDGHWVWVMFRGRVQTWTADGKPEWMFGINIEITALKRQEDALRKSQTFLKRTGEMAGVGGWEVDLRTRAVVWSDETCRIHGLSLGHEPRFEEALNSFPVDTQQIIRDAIERSVCEARGWDLELPFIRATGEQIWVRSTGAVEFEDGQPVRLVGALQDITESRAMRAELSEQHELLRVTLQSIGDAVITSDAHGQVLWLNPVAQRMTCWSNEEARGRSLLEVFNLVDEETRRPIDSPLTGCLEQGKIVCLAKHALLISRDGDEFGIEDSASPIRSDEGQVLGVVLVFRDVTEQRRLTGEMTYRATHDALTGLVNRSEFESRLRRLLQKAREDRSEHALLYIDIDQFKLVNDSCGHMVGDQLLQQVGKLFAEATRARDTLARLGGDEFAIILEHCSTEQAQRVAQQICDSMASFRFIHDTRSFRVGASIGLVPVDRRWSTTMAILQAADASCYAAKEGGRNRVHLWFDTDTAIRTRHGEMQWAMRIQQALDENRFELYAQRIERLGDDLPGIRAEALLRMVQEDGLLVLPGAFLPAAERFHLASRIDRWVLRNAIDWLKSLPDMRTIQTLSINLSGHSIGDRAFHRHAIEALTEAGPSICTRVCFEITETAAITNMTDASLFIDQIRTLGVQVALDDFGAGASSFGYLKTLPVNYLKIDGQFIQGLVDDPLAEAAVRCFVEVAKIVAVETVAEFVDRPEILHKLRELGIDYAQGFLVHKPAPINELLVPCEVHRRSQLAPMGS
jgi:diguanylate cyclase (GGDEF)-like protein/PAS domain S-box-containing protein